MSSSPLAVPRRNFLRVGAAAVAAPTIIAATALGTEQRAAPSDRMALAVVGMGSRGFNLIDEFLKERDVQIVAVCDVDAMHYRDRPWGKGEAFGLEPAKRRVDASYGSAAANGVAVTGDFRKVCEREDVDAVVVATPDHCGCRPRSESAAAVTALPGTVGPVVEATFAARRVRQLDRL